MVVEISEAIYSSSHRWIWLLAQLGIGIAQTKAGIGIPSFRISVRYLTEKMHDFIGLVWFQTGPGIFVFFIPYRTVQRTLTCTDMDGQAAGTRMDKQNGCRNTNTMFSPPTLVFHQFKILRPVSAFRHCGQSGTASYRLVRQCPAIVIDCDKMPIPPQPPFPLEKVHVLSTGGGVGWVRK